MPTPPHSGKELSSYFLYLIAFIEGGVVLATELICAQLFAPYFGNSLNVWATILIATLTALSLGYFTGGYYATREKRIFILSVCLAIATITLILQPVIAVRIIPVTLDFGISAGAFISSLFILIPPLFFMGMISPLLIQILSVNPNTAGKISGKVYMLSTLGGIVFIFLFGFLIIPESGIKTTILILSFLPAFLSGYLILFQKKRFLFTCFCFIFIFSFFIGKNSGTSSQKAKNSYIKVHYNQYGLLGQITVADDNLAHSRSLFINHISQSFMYIPTGKSLWHYVHRLTHYSSLKPEKAHVLLAGMGGGLLVKELVNLNFNLDVIELDKRMGEVSKEYFGLESKFSLIIDDFRHYIRTTNEMYDIVIIDISFGENQPSHVYTSEAFAEIRKLLKPDGFFFIHFPDFLYGEDGLAVRSVGKTLETSGFSVKILNTSHAKEKPGEIIFFSSKNGEDLSKFSYDRVPIMTKSYNFPIKDNIYLERFSFEPGNVLTDDIPTMDFLHERTVLICRKEGIEIISKTLLKEGYGIY